MTVGVVMIAAGIVKHIYRWFRQVAAAHPAEELQCP